jgi:hypothetical protein
LPFHVQVNSMTNEVHIFTVHLEDEEEEPVADTIPVLTFHPTRVWVGNSPETTMTKSLNTAGPYYDGNTMLLTMEGLQHILIHSEQVVRFEALAPLVEYVSPMGNNEVPYPYARDSAGNVYLIAEDIVLLHPVPAFEEGDPYTDFYERQGQPFEGITIMRIGQNQYRPTWQTQAREEYARLTHNGTQPMWLEGPAKKAKRYTENKYEAFMAAFGQALHAQEIPTTRIYAI